MDVRSCRSLNLVYYVPKKNPIVWVLQINQIVLTTVVPKYTALCIGYTKDENENSFLKLFISISVLFQSRKVYVCSLSAQNSLCSP